jgi:hypothetical protein
VPSTFGLAVEDFREAKSTFAFREFASALVDGVSPSYIAGFGFRTVRVDYGMRVGNSP